MGVTLAGKCFFEFNHFHFQPFTFLAAITNSNYRFKGHHYYDQVCRPEARLKVPLRIHSSKYHCLRYFNYSLNLWLQRRWSHIMVNVYVYQMKTATLTNVVTETITTTAATWITKNLTNANKVMIKQYIKTILFLCKNWQKEFHTGEEKIRRRKYTNIELKHSVCEKYS